MIYTIENKKLGKKWILTSQGESVKVEYFEYFSFNKEWRKVGGYFLVSKEYAKEVYGIIIK